MIENGGMERVFEGTPRLMLRNPDHIGPAAFKAGEHHPDFHADLQFDEAEQAEAFQRHVRNPASEPALAPASHAHADKHHLPIVRTGKMTAFFLR